MRVLETNEPRYDVELNKTEREALIKLIVYHMASAPVEFDGHENFFYEKLCDQLKKPEINC